MTRTPRTTLPSPRMFLLAAACALACAGARAQTGVGNDDNGAISPDRPDFVNSSSVVGKGRFQLEAGVEWDRQREPEQHTRTLTTPLTLRYGIGESVELRLETDGRSIEHDTDPASGAHTTTAGYADSAFGFKWHIADQQGKVPSYGLIVEAAVPSGSRELRTPGVRPVAYVPAEWDMPDDFSLGIMPGVGVDRNDDGAHYGYGVLAASLGKDFNERLHGFFEVALPQIARADNGGTQARVDTGLAWLVDKDCQVDAIVMHGLNRNTPGLSLGFGLSLRR
jgi:hypothetical protein